MNSQTFRDELRSRLRQNRDRILLRVVTSLSAPPVELTGADILTRAPRLASEYLQAPESGVVLLLLPHSVELFLLHLGLILEGRVPAILAWPTSRVDPEKYQANLLHQLRHLPARQLITLPQLAATLARALPSVVTACHIESAGPEQSFAVPVAGQMESSARPVLCDAPEDALFLQFSGGTTGAQKAVVVTAAMLESQLSRLAETLAFSSDDGVASWLPMYHDMGLIACLWLPLWFGAPSLQFSASSWLLRPQSLFQFVEQYRATFCWLPNFAFSYCAANRGRMKGPYCLKHVRAWINCSEPVRLRSLREFADAFSGWGVSRDSLQACYGMAENVFAVTQTRLGAAPRTYPRRTVRHRAAMHGGQAFDLLDEVYVSSGSTLGGTQVRIVTPAGELCGEGEPGIVEVRSQSLFRGYWTSGGLLTSSISGGGWYSTGDYGFLADGELFVIGRVKDIVIVGGQKVFPEDVEQVVNSLDGVYTGRVVAFGIPDEQYGTECIGIVAESRGNADPRTLEREISNTVLSTIGIAPRYVFVAPERWIVKSTAGKISRKETRERFARERLDQPVEV